MYTKYRNGPGHMHRSNAIGIGGATNASRVSPECSMRGHRMYNTEYYRDGYGQRGGRGRGRQFQALPPPQEADDIFMEAGRLAAEYLVSKGVLPPNALSGKWQNDGLKNQVGNFGFRQCETQGPANGRASTNSRLGNVAAEVGQSRRRYLDEYNFSNSRSSIRGRKRVGSFKDYGLEFNRELGRSRPWSEKSRASSGMDGDADTYVENRAEQDEHKDGVQEDANVNNNTLRNKKSLPPETDGKLIKRCNDAINTDDEAELEKGEINDNDLRQRRGKNEYSTIPADDTLVCDNHVDLVKYCKFVNVPTKTRSSVATRGSKVDREPKKVDDNISKRECAGGSGAHVDDDIGTSGSVSANQNLELFKSDILSASVPVMIVMMKELDGARGRGPKECLTSGSFSEISMPNEQKQEELSGIRISDFSFQETGQKRVADYHADEKDVKRIREWIALSNFSTSMENRPTPTAQEPVTASAHVTLSLDQDNPEISLFPKGHSDGCEFMEEKQLFPGSFKTCDLNLVGTSDGNESNDVHSMLAFPSVTEKVETIDIDLSMNNNRTVPYRNCKQGHKDNPIEVIDLENDSAPSPGAFNDPGKRGDVVFTDLDAFPNNVHSGNGISDVHDAYGLMISELLGNGSPNCSPVSTGLNSLHNHIGLSNTQGMFGDDDSIYMSLGEIPISILEPWEQPTQDYGKPF